MGARHLLCAVLWAAFNRGAVVGFVQRSDVRGDRRRGAGVGRVEAATLPSSPLTPLKIVPAIDVYAKVPPKGKGENRKVRSTDNPVSRWVESQDMSGPDPFKLVSAELAPFSDNIKVANLARLFASAPRPRLRARDPNLHPPPRHNCC